MVVSFQKIIDMFLSGSQEGYSGSKTKRGNLKIKENQLIHYHTPIAERYNDKFILNITRYSLQTGQLQKKIKESIDSNKRIDVKNVPSDEKVLLRDYISK